MNKLANTFNILSWLVVICCLAGEMPALAETPADYDLGVSAYRNGQYETAARVFDALHRTEPENVNVTYYLAITAAQMGHPADARRLYEEVLLLDPKGDAGQLAKEGLQYLPKNQPGLDPPPKAETAAAKTASATNPIPNNGMPNGMTPQQWMQMQWMMQNGSMNGMNGMAGGMNPALMMMQQQPGSTPGANTPAMDPNWMSSMMMNQMFQNFDLQGGENKDRE